MKIKCLDKSAIPYIIRNTKRNQIKIEVKNDGLVVIKVNPFLSSKKVNEFVEDNLEWITTNFIKNYKPPRKYLNNEEYLILGKNYKLNIVLTQNENSLFIEGPYLNVYTKDSSYAYIDKLFSKYKEELAKELFPIVLQKCFMNMRDELEKYPILSIKHYKSRWGCFIPKDNKIILNDALVHVDIELIEYVVYHELCHYKYHNHSIDFHNYLQKYVPDEKQKRKNLSKFNTDYR